MMTRKWIQNWLSYGRFIEHDNQTTDIYWEICLFFSFPDLPN